MLNFLTLIFLGTVVVQPEPVLNEDKDDFKGPEFRNRNTSRVKPEIPKKRGGKCIIFYDQLKLFHFGYFIF